MTTIQPTLRVGAPNDRFEQEADRVADQVMRMPEPRVQRQVEDEEEALLQAKAEPGGVPAVTPSTAADIAHVRSGGGQPLSSGERQFFEPRFGRDFSGVRVHAGAKAAEVASAVQARAFTVGRDVVFGAGEYAPGTAAGRRLMAHELTHTLQQDRAAVPSAKCLQCAPVQRAPVDGTPTACADLQDIPDEKLNCQGRSRDGPGEVVARQTGWEVRNFDVDRHFLKPEHQEGLKKILPALNAFLDATKGTPAQVMLVGEASTTAGTCYNLRLSRRRAKCVARALVALGVPASALKVGWIGDINAEQRLAMKPVQTRRDIENPDDRRVSIVLRKLPPPKPEKKCTLEDKLRASDTLDFRFGCLSRTQFTVVIANRTNSPPIYREFTWEKLFALPKDCEFFPDLDPSTTLTRMFQPVRLAWTEDPNAPSDFSSVVLQKSLMAKADGEPLHVLEFRSHNEDRWVDFPGMWSPTTCAKELRAGKQMVTIGTLKPAGPVKCGPMPVPKSIDCAKPPKEDCPKARRESEAKRFKVDTEPVPLTGKIIDLLGETVEGSEVRYIKIGTVKTNEEKEKSGDDIWRPYVFVGKAAHAPKGCEQRDPQDSARGETTLDDNEALAGVNYRPATLLRRANSNVEHLWIWGLGTFKLYGEMCTSGGIEVLQGMVTQRGKVRCEPLKMEAPPKEKTCKEDCPEARRTCADTKFRFKFGRMALASAPPAVQQLLLQLGCQAEAARVNIGTMSLKPIWRPFIWVQAAPCPFTVRDANLLGAAGKTTIGIKPKFKFKWPPITVAPEITSNGLRLATRDPDNPAAPTEFPSATELGSASLTGSGKSTSLGISGLTRTYYKMATAGAPVDWTGSCTSSDTGILIPAGKVDCGWAPAPQHEPAPKDACPTDVTTRAANAAYFVSNYGMLASLGNNAGIVTQIVSRGRPVYAAGDTVKNARFMGQVYGPGGKLEPVVVVFDMKVLSVIPYPGRIDVQFTILSKPCAYRWGIERVPLRLLSYSCSETLQQGQTYTIHELKKPPAPDAKREKISA